MLTLRPVPHANARVRHAGFPLDHPYVEQVWGSIIGPSALAMLRRCPVLWQHLGQPATVPLEEFGRSLGLRLRVTQRTLDRLALFGLADLHRSRDLTLELNVATQVAPLSARRLARVTPMTRHAHDRLLDAHIHALVHTATTPTEPPAALGARLDRLDHLQQRPTSPSRGLTR